MTNIETTETVNTCQLVEGDTIIHYGAHLLLTNRTVHAVHADIVGDSNTCRPVVTFDSQMVGEDTAGACDALLLTFLRSARGYQVQGNELAKWCRIGRQAGY